MEAYMNPYSIISLLASVIAFYTSVFIYYRNPCNNLNLLVSNLGVAVSFMAFTEFVYRTVAAPGDAIIWLRLSLLWPIIPSILLHTALTYTRRRVGKPALAVIYAPALIFILTGLLTDLFISGPLLTYYGWTYALPEPPVVFALFSLWTVTLTLTAATITLRDYLRSEGYRKRESLYIFTGLFVPLIVSFTTDFIFRDLMGLVFPEFTQTMLSIGLLFIAYGVWRYDFPELSPAIAARSIADVMPNFLIITDLEGRVTSCSRSVHEKLSYSSSDLRGKPFWDLFDPSDREMLIEVVSGFSSSEMETRIISAHGEKTDVLLTASPIRGRFREPIGFVFIATDISLQRRATERLRESEMRFRGVADNTSDGIAITDESDTVIYWNRALEEITSAGRDDALGRKMPEICSEVILEARGNDEFLIRGERVVRIFRFSIMPGLGAVLVRDVTETRRYEESLISALRERETLIREIHHRVKNNLQIISSLLNMQKPYIRDAEDLRIFEESQTRIKSMAMIHENLYHSETLSEINMSNYFSRLVTEILSTYGASGIVSDIRVDDLSLDIELAVPLALIVSELVTNSVKYAFPDGKGRIIISFNFRDGVYLLNYRDTGRGVPEDFSSGSSDSLGMTLVRALVGQLDGELETFNEGGAVSRITFPERSS
ncbi:histidine kinase dimerization/phosphoacceptor domain -containing protein [Methanothermobacter sp. THM-2]|uniref:histidine kinase dimerization/phosphoacceptor domain -containing protein n=1 Tax=Methanothermobacter sp. THM-2 TaxID=2606912 RepID=UPI0013665730|nr:histidine kinase dimerization/phosphoacceptor domain -containing protein [Methanothermobacter sp. THM-2]QHN08063.1 PAS domain S-box protein [Methanothermobacter sp. THM-2]